MLPQCKSTLTAPRRPITFAIFKSTINIDKVTWGILCSKDLLKRRHTKSNLKCAYHVQIPVNTAPAGWPTQILRLSTHFSGIEFLASPAQKLIGGFTVALTHVKVNIYFKRVRNQIELQTKADQRRHNYYVIKSN